MPAHGNRSSRVAKYRVHHRRNVHRLEDPVFFLHEATQVQTRDLEVRADVWDLGGIGFVLFHGQDCGTHRSRSGDQERIGVASAAQNLLLLEIGLKVPDDVDASNERPLVV